MKIIGHRGARGLAPENTLASIRRALETGADEVEVDIRVTKDNIPVLNHDPYIDDANGDKLGDTLIHTHTLTELRSYRPDLTTLDEAVTFIDKRIPINIEIKPHVSVIETVTALKQYLSNGWQPNNFLLASFSQGTLKKLHAELPSIEKVVNEHISGLYAVWRARQVGAKRILFNHRIMWWWFIRAMSRRGYHIIAYTLNDQHKAEHWAKYGLYGVVTDYPDRFMRQIETATKTPRQRRRSRRS